MYNKKKINITNFETITGLVIRDRWEAEYQGESDYAYRFNLIDKNTSWNYPFIEMELEKQIKGSSCMLQITLFTSPSSQQRMMTWVGLDSIRHGQWFANTLVKLVDEHFM